MRLVFQPLDVPTVRAPTTSAFTRSTRSGTTRSPARSRRCAISRDRPGAERRAPCQPRARRRRSRSLRDEAARVRAAIRRRSAHRTPHDERRISNLGAGPLGASRRREEGGCVRRHHDRGRDRHLGDGSASAATRASTSCPVTDTPSGFQDAIEVVHFDEADATKKRASLAALAAVENPLSHTAETVACAGCHVSTVVMLRGTAGIDPLTLPGRYTSKFDLSTAGGKSAESTFTSARSGTSKSCR